MYALAKQFLETGYQQVEVPADRPFVTLTYAQSLDSKISIRGQQLLLSGKESMAMTHRLRVMHDAILVGSGTACIDDPQLNARYLPTGEAVKQPIPVVLDARLDLPLNCKLFKNYQANAGKQPWIITTTCADASKKAALEAAGAVVLAVEADEHGRVPWEAVLHVLQGQGVHRLMVEGGSRVIQSCLSSGIVDALVVTLCPVFVGDQGLGISAPAATLDDVQYQTFGRDVVMMSKIKK
ncbi:dihydrofolate reductase-like domain-containing protein [Gongronella butleri]|nr:dihydrofolate reductase-like domain-containing protein [Gongronella butleri]